MDSSYLKLKSKLFIKSLNDESNSLFLFYKNNPALIIDLEIFKLISYANLKNIENQNFKSILASSQNNKGLTLTIPRGEKNENIAIVEKNNDKYEFVFGKLNTKFSNESYVSAVKFNEDFIEINRPTDLLMVQLILKSLDKFESDLTFLVCIYNIILGREIDWRGRIAYMNEKKNFRLNEEWRFYCCNELYKSEEYANSGNIYLRIFEIILNL